MKLVRSKRFTNGIVYAIKTNDGLLIETTDTFLPFYTKDAIRHKQNKLKNTEIGDRHERWMVGVSIMSGCPVRCRFCATGSMKKWRNLSAEEIRAQVRFIVNNNPSYHPHRAKEFKINYTRMGEPFLNIKEVRKAINLINAEYPEANIHHYISTIGIEGSDFSWIKDNITLQLSLHSLDEDKRNWLIPYKHKMGIEDLGEVETKSYLKTTLNMTLVDNKDFDIGILKKFFPPEKFFVKLSPVNPNEVSEKNKLGLGAIEGINLL